MSGTIMNPLEEMLHAHEIPAVSVEQNERVRTQVLGMNKIGDVGATTYRSDSHTLSVVEFSDGDDLPSGLIDYLKKLAEVQESFKHLTVKMDVDWRIFPALGFYTEQHAPTFSLPPNFDCGMILLAVLFTTQGNSDEDLIEFGCKKLLDISRNLEQALDHLGINIE